MAVNEEQTTLVVKHLPSTLGPEEQKDLLKHFGAQMVRCMGVKGRMKNTAFATFENHEAASCGLKHLHQLQVLGSRLVVEFSSSKNSKYHPKVSDSWNEGEIVDTKKDAEKEKEEEEKAAAALAEKVQKEQIAQKLNSLCAKWGFDYPFNPKLKYLYPPPTVGIITNIANTLATVPKFYVQVLHLMNKMNLPAPFGMVTPAPPIPDDAAPPPLPTTDEALPPLPNEPCPTEYSADRYSSEESEIESDDVEELRTIESKGPLKRALRILKNPVPPKRPKFQFKDVHIPVKHSGHAMTPSEVFDHTTVPGVKSFQFKLSTAIAQTLEAKNQDGYQPEEDKEEINNTKLKEQDTKLDLANITIELGGFGKIEPSRKDETEKVEEDEEEWGSAEFISSRRLRKGQLSRSEIKDLSVFKNYKAGEATSRLYIKNLSKQVTEKDLHYIYGRYVDWDKEEEKLMFDIRLMKEGRMKGQAFITLPSERRAQDALDDTNGFLLHEKPLVVQFARSAKPKADNTEDAKKTKK